MKKLLILICLASGILCNAAELSGSVRDEKGRGLPDVRVSDGFQVVKTDRSGAFKISVRPKSRQISVVMPKDRDAVKFYLPITSKSKTGYDFILKKRPVKTDFRFIQYSDHECKGHEYTNFLNDTRSRAKAMQAAFVVSSGDLAGENGILQQCKDMQRNTFGGIKTLFVCGNHDLRSEPGKGEYFYEDHCGPTRYAFEEGNVLFIVLPMIRGDRPPSYTAEDLADFTRAMLNTYPENQQFFIIAHHLEPGYGGGDVLFPGLAKDKQIPLAGRRFLGMTQGHTHWNNVFRGQNAPVWCAGQSRAGGGGNSPGALRVFHFTADGTVTSELLETNVNHRAMFCGDAASGLATISAYSSGAAVTGVEAVINGKPVIFKQRNWLWSAKITPSPDKPVRYRAVVNFADGKSRTLAGTFGNTSIKKTFKLQKMMILPGAQLFGKMAVDGSKVYTTISDDANGLRGGACAVDTASGKLLWHTVTGCSVRNSPVLYNGKVYFTDSVKDVQVLDAATGKKTGCLKHPSKPLFANKTYFGECIISGDRLFTGLDGDFRAIDLKTGKILWCTDYPEKFGTVNPYVLYKNRLYSAVNWGYLKCFDADTGKLLWDTTPPRRGIKMFAFQPNVTILDDRTLLYNHGSAAPEIIDAATGKTLKTGKKIRGSKTVSLPLIYKSRVYVGNGIQGLSCYDLDTMEPVWNTAKLAKTTFLATCQYQDPLKTMESSPVLINGKIAAVTGDGVLRILDADTGKMLDGFIIGAPVLTSPVYENGRLFVTDYIGRLFVFDIK